MKKILAIIALVLILAAFMFVVASNTSAWTGRTLSPELLGEANATVLQFGKTRIIGFTWNSYAGFLWYGYGTEEVTRCYLSHAWGGPVSDADSRIPCEMHWSPNGRFRGWIDFRGHPRKFCGSPDGLEFPAMCMWR